MTAHIRAGIWRTSTKEGRGNCAVKTLRWKRTRHVPLWWYKVGEAYRSSIIIIGSLGNSWGLITAVAWSDFNLKMLTLAVLLKMARVMRQEMIEMVVRCGFERSLGISYVGLVICSFQIRIWKLVRKVK